MVGPIFCRRCGKTGSAAGEFVFEVDMCRSCANDYLRFKPVENVAYLRSQVDQDKTLPPSEG